MISSTFVVELQLFSTFFRKIIMSLKIAVFLVHSEVKGWNLSAEGLNSLQRRLPGCEIFRATTEEEFVQLLPQVDAAFTWKYRNEWVTAFPNVRIIGTPAAGGEFLPTNLRPGTMTIRGTFHGITMSETAIGMMLAHSRRLFEADYLMKHGERWPRKQLDSGLRNLTGSHVAILGFGYIGQFTARRLKAFDCRLTGVRRSAMPVPDYFTAGDTICDFAGLKQVLKEVDHLVLFLPAAPDNTNLIAREVFELLPSHAAIYNLGRGNAVNEEDLLLALRTKQIAGAYLDVFQEEPLPLDSPLRRADNICLQPHSSAISPDYVRMFLEELPEKLAAAGELS